MGCYEGVGLKIARARTHFAALQTGIRSVFTAKTPDAFWRLRKEFLATEEVFVLSIEWLAEIPIEWSLLLGDAVHNLRAALDHLAWGLVRDGSQPSPPQPRRVQFPICNSIDSYTREVDERLPGVATSKLSIIEEFQPYHEKVYPPLQVLQDLSNRDKHRMLNLIYPRAASMTLQIFPQDVIDCEVVELAVSESQEPLAAGQELGRVLVRQTGDRPDLKIRTEAFVQPTFHNGLPATTWLERAFATVESIHQRFDPSHQG